MDQFIDLFYFYFFFLILLEADLASQEPSLLYRPHTSSTSQPSQSVSL